MLMVETCQTYNVTSPTRCILSRTRRAVSCLRMRGSNPKAKLPRLGVDSCRLSESVWFWSLLSMLVAFDGNNSHETIAAIWLPYLPHYCHCHPHFQETSPPKTNSHPKKEKRKEKKKPKTPTLSQWTNKKMKINLKKKWWSCCIGWSNG